MVENDHLQDGSRRNFLKGATATGLAALGVGAFSGGVAAQQNIRNLPVNVSVQEGLINVNVQNVNALNNIDIDDVVVTVIGGDAVQVSDVNVNIEDIDVDVDVSNVLNNNVVQVAVVALSDIEDTQNIVAAGSDALNI